MTNDAGVPNQVYIVTLVMIRYDEAGDMEIVWMCDDYWEG